MELSFTERKLGMWLFIASDSATFGALLLSYIYLRAQSPAWPTVFHSAQSIAMASAMAAVLLASSVTMLFAVRAASAARTKIATRHTFATAVGGVVFLFLHLNEWRSLYNEGLRLTGSPWGTPLFGATFFTLTGLHMLHVAAGVLYLAFISRRLAGGVCHPDELETTSLYWYFVDIVWMFIFPLVYLL
jgi:cytochrome c oxidase subunit III